MAQERTEAPTPRRRQKSREKGQTAKSAEINSVVVLIAGLLAFRFFGGDFYDQLTRIMRSTFENLTMDELDVATTHHFGMDMGVSFLQTVMPLFLVLMIAALVSNLAQTRLLFTLGPLTPDFNRINPLAGFQRLFSGRSLVELAKAMVKIVIVGWVAYGVFESRYPELVMLMGEDMTLAGQTLLSAVFEVAMKSGLALLVLAVVDYGYQRWEYEKTLRMTREELKEEFRHQEGSPEMRNRIRRQQRRMSMQRMMQSVPHATVVVTNPTHLAVALEYEPQRMAAPKVTAKGAEWLAQRIREVAQQHGVPIVENRILTWSLYRTTEVGDSIPSALYQAVAEVIAFVYRLENESRGRLRRGASAWAGS